MGMRRGMSGILVIKVVRQTVGHCGCVAIGWSMQVVEMCSSGHWCSFDNGERERQRSRKEKGKRKKKQDPQLLLWDERTSSGFVFSA